MSAEEVKRKEDFMRQLMEKPESELTE